MGNVSVALCIPTCERSEWISDFLENYALHYIEAGIDIYYYDGSESTKTEEVVCNYPQKEHIYYIKRPPEWLPLMIFQKHGLKKEYDFIWLCNDAIQLKKDAIDILMTNLSVAYDIVEVNGTGYGPGTKIFRNCNEYMQQCAWHTTLYGSILLNTHTMLDKVNWNKYKELFTLEWRPYRHVTFYFSRILELKQFCALHLAMDPQIVRGSRYKKTPGWIHQSLQVHFEHWVTTVEELPDYYSGKDKAIKQIGNFGLMTGRALCYLRMDRDYSLKEYIRYKNDWGKITEIPSHRLFILALTPGKVVKKLLECKIRKSRELKKLHKFYSFFHKIVIFGIGESAFRYAQYFEQQGMVFEGFCAQRSHGKKEYLGYPIFNIDDVAQMESAGMIVALGEAGAEVAVPDISRKMSADSIYFSADLEPVILYELGYGRG